MGDLALGSGTVRATDIAAGLHREAARLALADGAIIAAVLSRKVRGLLDECRRQKESGPRPC